MLNVHLHLSNVLDPEQTVIASSHLYQARDECPMFGTLSLMSKQSGREVGCVTLFAHTPADLDKIIAAASSLRDKMAAALVIAGNEATPAAVRSEERHAEDAHSDAAPVG